MAENRIISEIEKSLKERFEEVRRSLSPPFIYLDAAAARYLFQELAGVDSMPGLEIKPPEGDGKPEISIVYGGESRKTAPIHVIYEAMSGVLQQKVSLLRHKEELPFLVHKYTRLRGLMSATRFPDGEINLEIAFNNVRGLLFYTEKYFASTVKPFLSSDRFFSYSSQVEALVYVAGELREMIFYHSTYGDNKEHSWIPIVPVCIRSLLDEQALSV